jgi:hypothetical protein
VSTPRGNQLAIRHPYSGLNQDVLEAIESLATLGLEPGLFTSFQPKKGDFRPLIRLARLVVG